LLKFSVISIAFRGGVLPIRAGVRLRHNQLSIFYIKKSRDSLLSKQRAK